MTKRIIEIGSEGAYLHVRLGQLIITREGNDIASIPMEDMAALILDHPQSVISQACLAALLDNTVMVVTSDTRHQPTGMLLPLAANTLQTERFSAQASLSQPLRKQVWKQVVQAKIRWQAKVLHDVTGSATLLTGLVRKVRSGDPDNVEAQAARRYWSRLFPDGGFKRDRDAFDQNRYLNYGYAILRALTARSLCAAGLHPSLGIHHRNRYNAYCLADDFMEPFRPFVDLRVHQLAKEHGTEKSLDGELRQELLSLVRQTVDMEGETVTLQGALNKVAQSFVKVVLGESRRVLLPLP
ncbi:MAG: type II CRISPR-associated endonuclease Cas1 [Gammaproteobacteria bacterium]|nr:type II CRISPR-associated endonuclease Cas1 [Gammaproteobacteria bacterium]